MYNFVSSPNHIFVSCQHTAIKFSKRYWFLGSFSSGFDNFRLLVYFKSRQNRLRVDDRVLMDSDTTFVCLEAVWNSEMFDGDFVPCKNDRKDLYVQRKIFIINAIDQGISNTSKTLAVKQCAYLNNAFGLQSWCGPLRKQPSHPSHMTKSEKPLKLDRFTEGIFTWSYTTQTRICTINIWWWWGGGGRASLFPPAPTMQMSINFSRLWGAMS